jgi:DNA-binding NarL/FixJ family response regulator
MLVDDHAIVRRGLRSILELESDISVVAEAGDRSEALAALERAKPDVILLDLKLSADHDTEGLELCSEIIRRRPQSNVVILSTFLNESLLNQSLRRGAKAYVLKEVDLVELVRIIRRVSRGESGFDGRSAEMVRALVAGERGGGDPDFTQREVPRAQRDAKARRPQSRRGRVRRRQTRPARSRRQPVTVRRPDRLRPVHPGGSRRFPANRAGGGGSPPAKSHRREGEAYGG